MENKMKLSKNLLALGLMVLSAAVAHANEEVDGLKLNMKLNCDFNVSSDGESSYYKYTPVFSALVNEGEMVKNSSETKIQFLAPLKVDLESGNILASEGRILGNVSPQVIQQYQQACQSLKPFLDVGNAELAHIDEIPAPKVVTIKALAQDLELKKSASVRAKECRVNHADITSSREVVTEDSLGGLVVNYVQSSESCDTPVTLGLKFIDISGRVVERFLSIIAR